MVSSNKTIPTARIKWAVTIVENVFFNLSKSSRPNSNVKNLEEPVAKAALRNDNKPTTPPTDWYKPKSSTPKTLSTTREVYNEMTIVTIMRKYKNKVF